MKLHRNDEDPRFFFGKIYTWFVNGRGNYELEQVKLTAEDVEEFTKELGLPALDKEES